MYTHEEFTKLVAMDTLCPDMNNVQRCLYCGELPNQHSSTCPTTFARKLLKKHISQNKLPTFTGLVETCVICNKQVPAEELKDHQESSIECLTAQFKNKGVESLIRFVHAQNSLIFHESIEKLIQTGTRKNTWIDIMFPIFNPNLDTINEDELTDSEYFSLHMKEVSAYWNTPLLRKRTINAFNLLISLPSDVIKQNYTPEAIHHLRTCIAMLAYVDPTNINSETIIKKLRVLTS